MLIDVICFVLLLLAAWKGVRKGLIVALFSFLAFLIGLAAAMKLSVVVAQYIGDSINVSQRWLPVLAFLLVFIIVVLAVRLLARFIETVVKVALLGWANRLGGFLFYLLIYLFIFSLVLFYANQLHLIKQQTLDASLSYPYLQALAPQLINGLSYLFPFFKNMFQQLLDFFGKVAS